MHKISHVLNLKPGIISIIGGGGKTTFLHSVSQELPGTKVITTTTHFFPFEDVHTEDFSSTKDLKHALDKHPRLAAAKDIGIDKLVEPTLGVDGLAEIADWVLVEADGSRRLPFKAHASHEPVIPENSNVVIQIIGGSGFGKSVEESVHRPEIFCELAGCTPGDVVTPELLAKVLKAEDLCDVIIINQAEDPSFHDIATRLQANVPYPVYWGSIRDSNIQPA